MLDIQGDLFTGRSTAIPVAPWKPVALAHDEWPPNYKGVYAWRIETLHALQSSPDMLKSAKAYYSTRPAEFIMHWMDTYNPRLVGNKWIPFVFFKRQAEFIEYIEELRRDNENGLVEKCRDIGATWLACAYSVWSWLFLPDDATGWGSRKQELVDKLGDPDSIFEKIRLLIKRLPAIWLPTGYKPRDHSTFMKLMNPDLGSTVTGESGDNIGRGGRKSRYWKDEAQPLSARILTPTGWETMGDMRVGSLVIGSNGQCRLVTHINDCGLTSTYRITLRDGTSTECSENHLWDVIERRSGKTTTMPLSELIEKYEYNSPGGQTQYRYYVPLTDPVKFFPRLPLPLHPYVVGVLLGDGSIATVPRNSVGFTSADVEVVVNVAARLPEGCKVTSDSKNYGYRIVDRRGRMGNKEHNKSRARKAVVAAGIAGCLAHQKFIPEAYKFATIDERLELLQGLMDTDGSASGGTTTYHTSSKQLADDVRFIVQSLGGTASLNTKPDHRGFRDIYVLHIAIPEYMPLFKLTRKNNTSLVRKRMFDRSIYKIESIGEQTTRCITVDAPNGLYLTDHCIVTHNSAHYERPEKIEAALGDNTNVQIDISSVNGLGNVFHRRRENGIDWAPGVEMPPGRVRVFIFDWRDHPEKNQEWYDLRKARFESEGLQHVFAQEVDRNYSAAIGNTIINAEWLTACVDAHLHIPCLRVPPPDEWMAGLDVADKETDGDRNALAIRQWIILRSIEEWGERDQGVTTRRMVTAVRSHPGIAVQYDSIGVGAGVKTEYNRLIDDGLTSREMVKLVSWNAGASVVDPWERIIPGDDESLFNRDFFGNFKAQAWWSMRTRCYKTWRARTLGDVYPANQLISFDSSMPLLHKLTKELAQATHGTSTGLRMIVNKKPDGTTSPNLADSAVMCYFPATESVPTASIGTYSG